MTISAKILLDSRHAGVRLTTMELRYPRFIHSEFMTHRAFSRNASSSRAIPVRKALAAIKEDPVVPVSWGVNRPGMQAHTELTGWRRALAKFGWNFGRATARLSTQIMLAAGAHKQVANRRCEVDSHITVLVTGTSSAYANFFALRYHPAAQPEMQELAARVYEALCMSVPTFLSYNTWHLPFIKDTDSIVLAPKATHDTPLTELLCRVSAARCARVSYLNHDGTEPSVEKDLELFERLAGSVPMHASPTEHQACPDRWLPDRKCWASPHLHGNLVGWIQYRKTLPNEFVSEFMNGVC